jgi:hypothetical protein
VPETTTSSGGVRLIPGRLGAFVLSWRLWRSWRPAHYALLLLVHLQLFASGGGAGDWDWYDFIYPWADALHDTVLKYHQFPWWNPWSMSGQPFFAEPQTAVLMPDTLFLALFGAVVGYKVVILFYTAVGYEGSRFLCRHLYGPSSFVDGVSVIPALLPPLALHLGVGHAVLLAFWLFPWLLGLALTWRQSAGRALAFGAIVGCYFLTYVHYSIIIGFTIAGAIVLGQLARSFRSRNVWLKAALVVATALGLGLTRIALTAFFVSGFPRLETKHYPIVASVSQIVRTLIAPFQNNALPGDVADLGWWELGSYVGLPVLLLAAVGFWRGDRRLRPLHLGAIVCLVFAWNNRDKFLPGYWMHVIPPWKTMVVITRWRLFACYFLLLGAVQGLVTIRAHGRAKLAIGLAALIAFDLGFNIYYAYRGTFGSPPPPFQAAADPPRTIRDSPADVWRDYRANLVSMGSEFPLLGWRDHYPKRDHLGTPGYRGDFTGTRPLQIESWTPNRIVLNASPGDTLTINVNPSSYWLMNGRRLFPTDRAMEPEKPFTLVVPPSGRVELAARPPHLAILLLLQGVFALAAVLLFRQIRLAPGFFPNYSRAPAGRSNYE